MVTLLLIGRTRVGRRLVRAHLHTPCVCLCVCACVCVCVSFFISSKFGVKSRELISRIDPHAPPLRLKMVLASADYLFGFTRPGIADEAVPCCLLTPPPSPIPVCVCGAASRRPRKTGRRRRATIGGSLTRPKSHITHDVGFVAAAAVCVCVCVCTVCTVLVCVCNENVAGRQTVHLPLS